MKFPWKKEAEKSSFVEVEIEQVEANMKSMNPLTQNEEYERMLHIREELKKQEEQGVLEKLDPNLVLKICSTFGLAVTIMLFEAYGHIFTSKATSFLPKIL